MRDSDKRGRHLFRDFLTVSVGNGAGALAGFAALVTVSRYLTPEDFGLFSLLVAFMTVLVSMLDLGIPTAATRFTAELIESRPGRAAAFLRAALVIRIASVLFVAMFCWFFSGTISVALTGESSNTGLVRLALAGTVAMSVSSFGNAVFQSLRRFVYLALYAVTSNIVRLLAIVAIGVSGSLAVSSGLATYSLAPLAGVVLVAVAAHKWLSYPSERNDNTRVFSSILSFNKWLAVVFVSDAIATRVGMLVLVHLRGNQDVAIYSAAMQTSLMMPLVLFSFLSVFLPRVSSVFTRSELISYLKQSVSISVAVGIFFLPMIVFAEPLVTTTFGTDYYASGEVLKIMTVAFLINLLVNPMTTLLYRLNRTGVVAMLALPNLALTVTGSWILAPGYGATGVAMAGLFATGAWALAMSTAVVITLNGTPERIAAVEMKDYIDGERIEICE